MIVGGRNHNSRERQNKQPGRFSRKDSEERRKNRRNLTDSGSLNRSRTTERKRQKDRTVTDHLDKQQRLQRQKSTSQDSLFIKKGKVTRSKWKSDGQIDKQHYKADGQESDSEGKRSFCNVK